MSFRPSAGPSAAASAAPADRKATAVSAAICTRDRPDQLGRALRSLTGQAVLPGEILVVDNAPRDDASRNLVRSEHPGVRYIHEPIAGLDFARNRALAEEGGEIVAFLDDDAVADPDWVARTHAAFTANPRLAVCMGRVEALGLGTEGERLFEANGGFARGDEAIHLPDARPRLRGWPAPLIAWSISIGSGCSMAVRRHLLLGMGGFDEALDLGPELPGGGDLDLLWRCLATGCHVRYEPAILAQHEHRPDASTAIDQILGHNRALIAVLTKASVRGGGGQARATVLAFLAWRLLKPGVRLLRRAVGRDPLAAPALLRLWGSCWLGLIAYPRARRIASRRKSVQ